MRTTLGVIMNEVSGVIIIVVFCVCSISYVTIWVKIRTSAAAASDDTVSKGRRQQINRSGRIMTIFVLAFLVQWWPWAVQAIWAYFEFPPLWLIVAVSSLCNVGGIINSFAYTFMRIRYKSEKKEIRSQDTNTTATNCEATTEL